ncbi:MAG: hypothetical protein PHO34_01515 [Candidatus Omnitrophica bacterium]|nr:hypothetical protein [Candidatus Omnitrophota bacterium]MDD5042205.1 hypothetical protein [Candidatus Omnitrophota bacterium]MDD5500060.1 hypothetical protein [Candidatus Omnitrophota bacterium]
MVYLLAGQDIQAREEQLNRIKQEFLPKETRDFNLDTLYAKEAALKDIQEKLLAMPVRSPRRILVVRDADHLDGECRDFILQYAAKPDKGMILILVFEHYAYQEDFVRNISRIAKVIRFKEAVTPDTFTLNRQIEMKRADQALRLLNQLLKNGEAPERILGGLRYAWEKQADRSLPARRRLKLLLCCDLEIKTGKLKPVFALEKLVVALCGLVQAQR